MHADSNTGMPDQSAEIYEGLVAELVHLHSRWKILLQLYSTSEERINFLRYVARGFFGVIQESLRNDIILGIGRLTDLATNRSKQEHLSLEQLSKQLEGNVDSEFSSIVKTQIGAIKDHCKPIQKWRNLRVAHADLEDALHHTPKPVPEDEGKRIDDALIMIGELLNLVAQHYGLPHNVFKSVIVDGDAEDLIKVLELGVESRKQKLEQMFGPDRVRNGGNLQAERVQDEGGDHLALDL